MRCRLFACLFVVILALYPAHAQETRDYAITATDVTFTDDRSRFVVVVTVENQGATADRQVDVIARQVNADNRPIAESTLNALAAGESIPIQISFMTADFPPDSTQRIQIEVGIDAVEPRGSAIADDNIWSVTVVIPAQVAPAWHQRVQAWLTSAVVLSDERVSIGGYSFDRRDFGIYLVIALLGIIFLWLVTVIFRALFARPPRFGVWQPPYAVMPMYDQTTMAGRRQAWQQHAQNCIILAAPVENNVYPVKMLLGADGEPLNNWRIEALRLSQYDTYGRIARSQTFAHRKWINRLNRLLTRRYYIDEKRLHKMLRPIVRGLIRDLRGNINRKSAFLPVAFDMRFLGRHGEVKILFELYQFKQGTWFRIDQWEPTMTVVSSKMQENYTFTIHGKAPSESYKDYLGRLQDDLQWLLMETIRLNQPLQPETNQHDPFNTPDTLSGMEPLPDQS